LYWQKNQIEELAGYLKKQVNLQTQDD